ncbi:MAG: UDP-N-acetylmuramoyl-L-alanine--D-glutamate ligase [Candidatus Omnitrophica bacterium]|nr:UDP-N-acetylmuramoyl-L-alanine--D-glutamate ligase [Candidatus Omnitrophota bacterium]
MRKVVVVGLGRSGIASARLLAEHGDAVFITEIKDDSYIRASLDSLIKDGVVERHNVELGENSNRFIKDSDLMVISPGVRADSEPVKIAERINIPVVSELELASSVCLGPIIAVTGTSGKTTVITLIHKILTRAGLDAILCGNIGNPLSGEIKRITKNTIVVLEVSSFQLERIRSFKPKLSLILNISENHLDRHRDMEEYIYLKSRIFSNQDEGSILFLNGKDKILKRLSKDITKLNVEFFDEYKGFSKRYNIENENFLAAMSVASEEGVNEGLMLEVISGFKGIEHRLEYVTTINEVDFINDSKATTVSSVEWALKSLNGRIVLIMGGRYKGGDFARLKDFVKEKARSIIAIGEARSRIKKDLSIFKDVIEEDDLNQAVHRAFEKARTGDKILLSPGCSSFDMFKNYEERGRVFKEICLKMQGNT